MKAVLFDLDNTLIDFMTMKKASCEAAVNAMIAGGVQIDKEEALKVLFELLDEHGYEYNLIFQRFLERIHKKIDYKILAAGIIAYRKVQQGFLEPYAQVVPTLLALKKKGLKIGIVTDAPRLKAWMRLTEIKLQDFFDVVVAYGDVEERKPSSMPFQKALDLLELDAADVLMVGDMPEKDILGAKKMGMKTCFARYGWLKEPIKTEADHEIDSIEKLMRVL
jgi:HAD superfamily hydrolase (TIGR02253 family)